MLKQYPDFDVKHFTKTFNSSPYYDGNINGFDIMIMQSDEYKQQIKEYITKYIEFEDGDSPLDILEYATKCMGINMEDLIITDEHELLDWIAMQF